MGNRTTNITIELDDHLSVHDMFLTINRWRSTIRERSRPGDGMRYDVMKALEIIKNTIGILVPCKPESSNKVQKSKYELRDKCNELNKQDFNAIWGPYNYEDYRTSKPGVVWEKTTGFMKIFKGNDLLGRDDEISFVFKTSFRDKEGVYIRTNINTTRIWRI